MNPSESKILIVDDDPSSVELLSFNLKREGYSVSTTDNGKEAIRITEELKPNLILLDVMLPGMDGIETCELIRENPLNNNILIVFHTERSEDYSQIAGLNAGADDYIIKPLKPKVLISRLRAILRRYGTHSIQRIQSKDTLTFGDLTIDPERHIVLKANEEIIFPRKEFKLLYLLLSKPSRVFTRDEIYSQIWGDDIYVGDRTIDVYIRKIREKIGDERIKTIKGVGYKYDS